MTVAITNALTGGYSLERLKENNLLYLASRM